MPHLIEPASILLPVREDLESWSVVACDQFTSQPSYWERAEELAGEGPSALRLILPEAWLHTERADGAPERIAETAERYLRDGVFREIPDALIYVERTQPDGRVRRGLVGALDLEQYDYAPGSRSPIRATEGTVAERLPPRVAIRRRAALEMTHTIVLMDDREDRVLSPLHAARERMKKLYDFELMLSGGHLRGWLVEGERLTAALSALDALGDPALQQQKYGEAASNGPLTLAIGDGNHSLAAAKNWWEELRPTLEASQRVNHPARFALVELENIHDPALDFEPIHRLLTDTDTEAFPEELSKHRQEWEAAGLTLGERVAAAESFCRSYVERFGGRIDYIHGDETAQKLGSLPGRAAVLLPPVEKDGLFASVLADGALPKKSFSMGQAADKRYYLECRRLR
ncbi:MAG: DUF1015 domain-containing protein [Oscillospiraceae bacterium]|nr:DUF1015 domain-containing protein [Oscillospiraceae bacterium]